MIYQTTGDNDYYRIAFTNVNNTTINYLNSLNNIGGNILTLTYKIDNNVQYTYSGLLIDPSAIFMNDSGVIGFNFTSTPTLVDFSAQGAPLIISNVYAEQTISMITSNSNIWIMTYSEPVNMLKQNINNYQISNNNFMCKLPYDFVINNISDLSNIQTQTANTVAFIYIDTTTNTFYIVYYTGNETINLNNVSPNTITNVHIDKMSFVLKYVEYNIYQSVYTYTITSYTHDL